MKGFPFQSYLFSVFFMVSTQGKFIKAYEVT